LKVEAIRQELFNPVLTFKQQGVDDELKVLQRDDFLLVIMTKQQSRSLNLHLTTAGDQTHKLTLQHSSLHYYHLS
jgi:hypothetical protein